MSELKRINDQLKRAFEGKAWHGPSVSEVLTGVTAEQAAAHPIAGAHSIWELTLHIATWERAGRRRIQESDPVEVSDEEDWPAVEDTSDEAWQNALEELRRNHEALREAIRGLDEARLEDIILQPWTATTPGSVPGTQYSI
ncbi:MAG: hypothetical protein DMF60_08770 [Acidobacteria bacterium]|nr:MAG: hypothetical protein DMF60_08770 [Acidobacteriota bacterium]